MCRDAADTKIRSFYPVFHTRTEKIHAIPQNSCLPGQYLNSVTPEHKTVVSITRQQIEVTVTSCVLPTFRRTVPLNDIPLYQPYKTVPVV